MARGAGAVGNRCFLSWCGGLAACCVTASQCSRVPPHMACRLLSATCEHASTPARVVWPARIPAGPYAYCAIMLRSSSASRHRRRCLHDMPADACASVQVPAWFASRCLRWSPSMSPAAAGRLPPPSRSARPGGAAQVRQPVCGIAVCLRLHHGVALRAPGSAHKGASQALLHVSSHKLHTCVRPCKAVTVADAAPRCRSCSK